MVWEDFLSSATIGVINNGHREIEETATDKTYVTIDFSSIGILSPRGRRGCPGLTKKGLSSSTTGAGARALAFRFVGVARTSLASGDRDVKGETELDAMSISISAG